MSACAFVCERILLEANGVASAIRIIDVFYVPENNDKLPDIIRPAVQVNAIFLVKSYPHYSKRHELEVVLVNTVGEKTTVGKQTVDFLGNLGPEFPAGATLTVQFGVAATRMGTCYLCLLLDGKEITRTSFTLTRPLAPAADAQA